MAKPSIVPNWASTDTIDPITGQPNRAVPDAGVRATGFTWVNRKPARGFINWLYYILCEWVAYFDTCIDQPVKVASDPTFHNLTVTGLTGGTITSDLMLVVPNTATFHDSGVESIIRGTSTNIEGDELETLSDGSVADGLHTHAAVQGVYAEKYNAGIGQTIAMSSSAFLSLPTSGLSKSVTMTTADKFVIVEAGVYVLDYSMRAGSSSGSGISCALRVSGGSTISTITQELPLGISTRISSQALANLSVGNVIEIYIENTASNSITVAEGRCNLRKIGEV